ncbi:hypothetical protein PoB_005128400, partial [Plakobranchus ocellatus]
WLGAKTQPGKANLVWETDQESVNVSNDWWAHQAAPQISEGQISCLVINTESSLDILSCDSAQHYICQIYVGNPCAEFLPGAEYYSDTCFLPIAESLTFEKARIFLSFPFFPFPSSSSTYATTTSSPSSSTSFSSIPPPLLFFLPLLLT